MDGISARAPTDVTVRFHIQTTLALEDLGLLWRDLEARADITFFLSWDWMGAWVAELDAPPLVLVGEASGALVLLGLLVPRLRREAAGAIRVRGLHLHATGRPEVDVIGLLATFDDQAASRNLRSSRSRLARPYICRLRVLSRLICPSV